ncbi:MAG TPA: hypothetical protein VFK52_10550 [Nocardioidaceae bacterium]|nr:hypothetical protein [Nocardioidaceae bacterium]
MMHMIAGRLILTVLLAAGLIGTSVGWYRSESADDSYKRFDSCSFDGNELVLRYTYGANQVVSPSVDMTGREVVVRLDVDGAGGGFTPSIGLLGQARFAVFGGQTVVKYPDDEVLNCSRDLPGHQ